jgi:hypothetical protein
VKNRMKRTGLVFIGFGILAPVFLLTAGGYLTATNAVEGCLLFFKSYGIGLLFPGLLFFFAALWLPNERGLIPSLLTLIFAIPAGTSFMAILTKFAHWSTMFTIGQGISYAIFLMLGIGLIIRQLRQRSKAGIIQD